MQTLGISILLFNCEVADVARIQCYWNALISYRQHLYYVAFTRLYRGITNGYTDEQTCDRLIRTMHCHWNKKAIEDEMTLKRSNPKGLSLLSCKTLTKHVCSFQLRIYCSCSGLTYKVFSKLSAPYFIWTDYCKTFKTEIH